MEDMQDNDQHENHDQHENIDLHVGGYHLTESIGTGGMGSVFKATVEAEGKSVPVGSVVAVKLLHPHLRSIKEFIQRFHREARLAAKIDHPNVIRVLDEGVENRHHFIVMEYAEGIKLADLMSDDQPLSPQQTIEIMSQICEALKAAGHIDDPDEPGRIRSIVHRDVKPDNIIIQPLDREQHTTMIRTHDKTALASIRVKLLDFGLAKDVKALSTILSQTGQSLGTPAYMSPEQCTGGDVDTRSDLYSIGVCAYHMITGTTPFAGPTTVAFAQQHADEIPPDILKRNPLCPKNLADCIYRLIAKSPKDRYQSPADLQADLVRVSEGKGVSKIHKFKKRGGVSKRKIAAIAGVCSVLILAIVAGLWFMWTDQVKGDVADAIRRADTAAAEGEFTQAKDILTSAIDAVPPRPDREALIRPAADKFKTIATRAAAQQVERRKAELIAHQQDAVKAAARIEASIAAGEFDKAISAGRTAIDVYGDTPTLAGISKLLASAESGKKTQQTAEAARIAAEEKQRVADAKAAHGRFIKYRDSGIAAMNSRDYHAAIRAFDQSLAEEDNIETKNLRKACVNKVTRHRIAVADFKVKGNVGITGAGETVPELLLPEFGQERFQLVERSQLAVILQEHDLTMADIVSNPALLRGKKLKGLRYLVLGSVVKLGSLAISARLVDVRTGDMLQTAKVTASNAEGLQDALGELAKLLQMTPAEKKAYLDEKLYPELLAKARRQAGGRQYAGALSTYRRVLAIRSTVDIRDELKRVEANKTAWENLQAAEREKERKRLADLKLKQEQFDALIAKARVIVARMPSGGKELTFWQKRALRPADTAIKSALRLKPSDATATALGRRIAKLLEGGKYITVDLGSGVTMKLVKIPAGRFMMGSPNNEKRRDSDEGPQHRVTISRAYYMGVYEVTQEQYQAVMGKNPSRFKGAKRPVEKVSWNDSVEFCKRLSRKTGKTFRLPTEAEWEYACRGGTTTRFSFGDSDVSLSAYAWYSSNSGSKTHDVGQKKPNAFGLYDMHGNVLEWCNDYWKDKYSSSSVTDPAGPVSGLFRVFRGGSWGCSAWDCRSAGRIRITPDIRGNRLGFRVVSSSGRWISPVRLPEARRANPRQYPSPPKPIRILAKVVEAKSQLKHITVDVGKGITMKLVKIPAGRFIMGSSSNESGRDGDEGPQHRVTISKSFYMGVYEVTQAQYQAVMGKNPSKFKGVNRPVEKVSWNNAVEFCKRLSRKTGKTFRLPTEAEWEYACRGGTTSRFSFGNSDTSLSAYAWYGSNSGNKTHDVGQKKPNAFGLYEMHGNVWEWCNDWKGQYSSSSVTDPAGPVSGSYRVFRGGYWINSAGICRSANRSGGGPGRRSGSLGFRVVSSSVR